MTSAILEQLRGWIQEDPGQRGLRTDPVRNLITACAGDFAAACQNLAAHPRPAVAIVTGFFIPQAQPPAGETDGPLGALFLTRALTPLGIRAAIVTDDFCRTALQVGLMACGLEQTVPLLTLPAQPEQWPAFLQLDWLPFVRERFGLTHLIALERPGPSHTLASLQRQQGTADLPAALVRDFLAQVPMEDQDRCHNMAGRDITSHVSPAYLLFEAARQHAPDVTTIGIGDGGNEIGMGKILWDIIQRNIPGGGKIACRVPTDFLLVCGVSNWGAYGLGIGVHHLRQRTPPADLFDREREHELLQKMVNEGPLVDGVLHRQAVSVDGLPFDRYAEPLQKMRQIFLREQT